MMNAMRARAYLNGGGMHYSRNHRWRGLRHSMEALVRGV